MEALRSRRTAGRCQGVVQGLQRFGQALPQGLAGLGQGNMRAIAREQGLTAPVLQGLDMPADGAGCDMALGSGTAEGAQPGGGFEGLQDGQGRQGLHIAICSR